jgi:hypothetical protein
VLETTWRVLLFALVAGLSPVAIVSTLAVLTSRRGRTNGLAFVTGFLLAQAAVFLTGFFIGSAATTDPEGNEHLAAGLELAFGATLLVLAWPQRKNRTTGTGGGGTRTKALLERLRGLRPVTAFSFGALLGVGVKRLTITIVAGGTVGVASLLLVEELALGLLYLLVACVLVWVPVGVYVVAGARADDWMAAAEDWLLANERRLGFFSSVVFGLLLISDAMFRLL